MVYHRLLKKSVSFHSQAVLIGLQSCCEDKKSGVSAKAASWRARDLRGSDSAQCQSQQVQPPAESALFPRAAAVTAGARTQTVGASLSPVRAVRQGRCPLPGSRRAGAGAGTALTLAPRQ